MPNHPDFHQMRRAAGHDEDREAEKHPMELEVLAPTYEIDERERDRKVRQCDQRIGHDMQAQHTGLPQVTHPVRHEVALSQELLEPSDHRVILAGGATSPECVDVQSYFVGP